jgi:NAD(P)H-hydrate repair Nnr-like enzyme with NAD(P)H-hydrate dehydratase domain
MLLISGIVPDNDFPLTMGQVKLSDDGNALLIEGQSIPCVQGTTAMISAAIAVTEYLGIDSPHALLAGDTGAGIGSRRIYNYLIENIVSLSPKVLALHYCLPILGLIKNLDVALQKCNSKPVLIADAGSMYAVKAAGLAPKFDLFTPDSSELAFLADPEAIHPAYIKRHLFEGDIIKEPELIKQAYEVKGAAKVLLVKGAVDYIAADGEIKEKIDEPNVPELECIGGTGDTITGMVTALAYAGLELSQAASISAKVNRTAGRRAAVTPASRVAEVISCLPSVLQEYLSS